MIVVSIHSQARGIKDRKSHVYSEESRCSSMINRSQTFSRTETETGGTNPRDAHEARDAQSSLNLGRICNDPNGCWQIPTTCISGSVCNGKSILARYGNDEGGKINV
jgi:hypothetical protein